MINRGKQMSNGYSVLYDATILSVSVCTVYFTVRATPVLVPWTVRRTSAAVEVRLWLQTRRTVLSGPNPVWGYSTGPARLPRRKQIAVLNAL